MKEKSELDHLDSVINLLPDVWYIVDTEGVICRTSHKMEREYGCLQSDLIGVSIGEVFNNQLGFESLHQETIKQGQVVAKVMDVINPYGQPYTLSISTTYSKEGAYQGLLIGNIRNVTGHAVLNSYYQDSLLNFVDVMNSSLDGMLIINKATKRIIEANETALKITGYTIEELKSVPLSQAAFVSPDEMERFVQLLEQNNDLRFNRRVIHRSGEYIDIEISARIMHVGEGELFQCNIRDITLKKKLYKINRLKQEVLTMKETGRTMVEIVRNICEQLEEICPRIVFASVTYDGQGDKWIFSEQTMLSGANQSSLMDSDDTFDFLKINSFNNDFKVFTDRFPLLSEEEQYTYWSVFPIYKGLVQSSSLVLLSQSPFKTPIEQLESLQQLTHILGIVHYRIEQEKRLVNSENRYRELVEHSPMAIGVYVDGEIVFSNQEFLHILRIPQGQVIDAKWLSGYVPVADMPDISGLVTLIRAHGQIPVTEITLEHRDGEFFTLMFQGTLVDYHGREGIQFVFYDISQRKQFELELKMSREKFELAAQGSEAGIWDLYDLEEGKMWWSPQLYKLIGYEPGEISFSMANYAELIHPEDRVWLREEMLVVRERHSHEYRLRTKSGEYRWFHVSGQTQFNEAGEPIRRVGTLIDIHHRKEAENKLRDRERLLNTTGKVAKVGGWQLDRDTSELRWTDQTYTIYGLKKEEGITLDHLLSFYKEADQIKITEAIAACFEGEPFELTFRLQSLKGKLLWVDFSGMPVYENGEVIKVIGAQRDLTHYIRQIEGIRENEEKLKNANQLAQLANWEWYLEDDSYYWSEELFGILGVSRQKPSFELFESVLDNDSQRYFAELLQDSLTVSSAVKCELKVIHPELEEIKYISVRAINQRNERHKVTKVLGTVQDITERKMMELDKQKRELYAKVSLELNAEAAQARNDWQLTNEYCQALVMQVGFDWAWIADHGNVKLGDFNPLAHQFSLRTTSDHDVHEIVQSESAEVSRAVIETQQPIWIEDLKMDTRFSAWSRVMVHHGFYSYICLPFYQGDRLKGTINLYSTERVEMSDALMKFLGNLSNDYGKSLYAIELKRNRDELNEFNSMLVDSLDVVSVSYDQYTGKVSVFGNTKKLVGFARDQFMEMIVDGHEYVHINDLSKIRKQVMESKSAKGNFDVEFRVKGADGKTVWLHSIGKVYWQKNVIRKIVGIMINMRHRKEEEVNMIKSQITVRDQERMRIARAIHDSLGQTLTIACMSLDALSEDVKKLDKDRQELYHDAYQLLIEAMDESRAISHNLMPSLLMDFGLVKSIRSDVTKLNKSGNIQFDFGFDASCDRRFDQDIEMNLYNISREAITNIIKHSGATDVDIQLRMIENTLLLSIVDNGVGFDTTKIKTKDGLGLGSIESRAISIGADIYFSGDQGCAIHVELDLIKEN